MTRPVLPTLLLAALTAAAAQAAAPSFDCARADSAASELVCRDQGLAALEMEVDRLLALAKDRPRHGRRRADAESHAAGSCGLCPPVEEQPGALPAVRRTDRFPAGRTGADCPPYPL